MQGFLLCQAAERRHLCLPSQVLVLLMRWRGPVLKALLSRAPVTTGDEGLGVQTGTGEAVATMSTLGGCLHGSL